jgi:predicted hotdog family 3-hydroxylacyl-ACP dehydratase
MAVDLATLLPQTGDMRLLDALLLHEPERTVCGVDPLRSGLFDNGRGVLPAWLALEYMAQCAAVHGALALGGPDAAPPPNAMLLGALELRPLEVEASLRGASGGLVAFDCSLRDAERGTLLAAGRLNVYTLAANTGQGESPHGS